MCAVPFAYFPATRGLHDLTITQLTELRDMVCMYFTRKLRSILGQHTLCKQMSGESTDRTWATGRSMPRSLSGHVMMDCKMRIKC